MSGNSNANSNTKDLMQFVAGLQSPKSFQDLHWEGSFAQYLDTVKQNPNVARNAFQRMYDMIVGFGTLPVHGVQEGSHAL